MLSIALHSSLIYRLLATPTEKDPLAVRLGWDLGVVLRRESKGQKTESIHILGGEDVERAMDA